MANASELLALPVSGLLALMKAREVSPVELMEATLAKAEEVNATTSAFLAIAADRAMDAARRMEDVYRRGDDLPPLAGLPISIKDTEPTQGIRTTLGSAIHRNNVPDFDGAAAANLKRAGAIVFAKSNTPAFAAYGNTENLLQAPCRNPLRLTDTPGGSSGGAAAAVAAGIGPVAHGTDGGGSVRMPASLCGLVGFKPSYGVVPYWPRGDLWEGRAHHGVLSRTLEDAVLTMRGLTGASEFDPLCLPGEIDWRADADIGKLRGKRGLYIAEFPGLPVEPVIAAACAAAVDGLRDQGLVVEEGAFDLPSTIEWLCHLWHPPLARMLRPWLEKSPDLVDAQLLPLIESGSRVSLDTYLHAREKRTQFNTDFVRRYPAHDFIICPTMPCLAWPVNGNPVLHGGQGIPDVETIATVWEQVHIYNLLGWPAISMPCGYAPDGRAIGIQVATKRNEDLLCLAVASLLETATAGKAINGKE